jgi:hypothetical protein
VTAATDALREQIEAIDIDAVESEVDELRAALEAARTALKDRESEVRTALANVIETCSQVRTLCRLLCRASCCN